MVCLAPKSNSGVNAISAAQEDVRAGLGQIVPRQLQNVHYDGEEREQKGQNYIYPHMYPNHWVYQQYLPDDIRDHVYYEFGENKTEQAYKAYWDKIKNK
jgi:putative ATPase